MAAAGFDRARPLWEFTLIEGLYDADGTERAAFAMKVHHAVTDGVGGMALLALLVDLTADAAEPDRHAGRARARVDERGRVDARVDRALVAPRARRRPPRSRRWRPTRPSSALRDPLHAGADLVRTAGSIGRMLAPATEPMSPVMRTRGLGRRLDTFDLSLDDLRRAAKATEGSVNDVFVAAVIGGLHRYHARHGDCPDSLRMTLPINLRREGDDAGRQPLRTGALRGSGRDRRSARARAGRAQRSCASGAPNRRCNSPDRSPACSTGCPPRPPPSLFGGMLKCCDFVATNVPGAPVPVYAAGARVDRHVRVRAARGRGRERLADLAL